MKNYVIDFPVEINEQGEEGVSRQTVRLVISADSAEEAATKLGSTISEMVNLKTVAHPM